MMDETREIAEAIERSYNDGYEDGLRDAMICGWISCTQPPNDERNVFLARGTNDFATCCIGHYDHEAGRWYEDRNWFASPVYDCKYWCDIPKLPDMGVGARMDGGDE